MKKYIRKCGKITDILPLAWLITFALTILGQLIGEVFMQMANGKPPWLDIALQYFSFISIWAVGLSTLLFKDNKPMLKALKPNKYKIGNNWRGILFGAAVGFGMNAFCAVISMLFKDIGVSFSCFEPLKLIVILFCVTVQSGAEELLCRWYLLEKLARRYKGPWVPIIGNAMLFALLHFANPGINFWSVTQIIVVGVLLSLLVMYYNSFYAAVFVHTLWNFTQNIIFGLPNSGKVTPYSIFHLDAGSSGFFFDPGFGIEGTPGSCLVIILVIVLLILNIRKRKLRPIDLWKDAEKEAEQAEQAKAAEKTAETVSA